MFFYKEGPHHVHDISTAIEFKEKTRPRISKTDEHQKWPKGFGSPSTERPPPSHCFRWVIRLRVHPNSFSRKKKILIVWNERGGDAKPLCLTSCFVLPEPTIHGLVLLLAANLGRRSWEIEENAYFGNWFEKPTVCWIKATILLCFPSDPSWPKTIFHFVTTGLGCCHRRDCWRQPVQCHASNNFVVHFSVPALDFSVSRTQLSVWTHVFRVYPRSDWTIWSIAWHRLRPVQALQMPSFPSGGNWSCSLSARLSANFNFPILTNVWNQ